MNNTTIEWTNKTWNPITGCTPISPGCANCYARRMAKRLAGRVGYPEAPHEFDVTLHPERLGEPLRWKKPARVFVCSMSDLFHEDVSFEFVDKIMAVIGRSQQHTFQILTKRSDRMAEYFAQDRYDNILREAYGLQFRVDGMGQGISNPSRFGLPNIWIGVTAENQEQADKRIPTLLQIPAVIKFVSVEPMLGPVDLRYLQPNDPPTEINALTGTHGVLRPHRGTCPRLNWVIVGGETGPGARPMHPDWARSLRDQCVEAGTPFFFKSYGDWIRSDFVPNNWSQVTFMDMEGQKRDPANGFEFWRIGKKAAGRWLDGREWNEYPEVK